MDICISESPSVMGTQKVGWITELPFKPSFKYCKELRPRKRRRDNDECNLFSRIQSWAIPLNEIVSGAVTSQMSPSSHLSSRDSHVDINTPPAHDDGSLSAVAMPDSRSEELSGVTLQPKHMRLNSSKHLSKKESQDDVKLAKESSCKSIKHLVSEDDHEFFRLSDSAPKKYQLVSNSAENGPLVIKLRACPFESQLSAEELSTGESELPLDHIESLDAISSTVLTCDSNLALEMPVPQCRSGMLSKAETFNNCRSHLSSEHQKINTVAVVSSTTKHRKCNRTVNSARCAKFTDLNGAKIRVDATTHGEHSDLAVTLGGKLSPKLDDVSNSYIGTAKDFLDDVHKTDGALSTSVKKVRANSRQGEKSSRISTDKGKFKSRGTDSSMTVVTSTCGVTENGDLISEEKPSSGKIKSVKKLHSRKAGPVKYKTDADCPNELPKLSNNTSVSTARHPPANYQVTRRHGRLFRRSTLVPQLHQFELQQRSQNGQVDHYMKRGSSAGKKEEELRQEATPCDVKSFKDSFYVNLEDTESLMYRCVKEETVLDKNISSLPSTSTADERKVEQETVDTAQPNSMSLPVLSSLTTECQAENESMSCERLPTVSNLFLFSENENRTVSKKSLPTDLTSSNSFISDQIKLVELRHSVFCLIKTLVPQLHITEQFDLGGHAVDDLVNVVCEELGDVKLTIASETHGFSSGFESTCPNAYVDMCRSPTSCLVRLQGRIRTMLGLLLGLDLNEFDDNLLTMLLDTVKSANRISDDIDVPLSSIQSPECVLALESDANDLCNLWDGEELPSVDSPCDIPELLVESERKITDDFEDFPEPPKLTAVNER